MTVHSRTAGRFQTQPTVPLAPLVNMLVRRHVIPRRWTIVDLGDALGGRTIARRAVISGHLNVWVADRVATQTLAVHPTHIWGDEWLDANWCRAGRIDGAFDQLREEMAA